MAAAPTDVIRYPVTGMDARGGKLIANDVMVLLKKLGTVDAKVEGRIVIQ